MDLLKGDNNELLILHLSDLHFGKCNPHTAELEFFRNIWKKIQEKLLKRKINLKNIDIVVVTGDTSSIGSNTDFSHAKDFFNEVLYQLIDRKKFIIIPGNHDIEWADDAGKVNDLRFKNYLKFKHDLELKDEKITFDNYLHNPHFLVSFDRKSTCILGLNSCLYTYYDPEENEPNEYNKYKFNKASGDTVKISMDQLLKILSSKKAKIDYNYKIALLHHNILQHTDKRAFLENHSQIIDELNKSGFLIVMHGHLHRDLIDRYGAGIILGAGSYGVNSDERDRLNQLSVIKLRKESDFLPLTYAGILNIRIDYEAKLDNAVTVNQDWIEIPVEVSEHYLAKLLKNRTGAEKGIKDWDIKNTIVALKALEKEIRMQFPLNSRKFLDFASNYFDKFLEEVSDREKIPRLIHSNFENAIKYNFEESSLGLNPSTHAFAWSPIRALMKKAGAEIVSRAAVDKLMEYLEENARNLTGSALNIAKHSGRKKITQEDMKIAIGMV